MSAFGPKRSHVSHLMSLSGVKRTCRCALHMSAFDPKRTLSGAFPEAGLSRYDALPCASGEAMSRRDFIKVSAGSAAAAWPLATRAQQPPVAVIGFLRQTRAEESGHLVAAVREGLRESGYSSDKVIIESRWGDGREEQLPKLARELVALPVAAIVAGSSPPARAARVAPASIT